MFEKDQTQLLTAYEFVAKMTRLLKKNTENNDQSERRSLEIVEPYVGDLTSWA